MNVPGRNDYFRLQAAMLMLGFKYLAWLNGLGLLLVMSCALGLISTDFSPDWLRLPLLAFSCGILFCGLSLLWAYLAQTSLINQSVSGYSRRTHWVPLTCTIIAFCLSLVAFLIGCWLLVYLAGISYQSSDADAATANNEVAPYIQSDRGHFFQHYPDEQKVVFLPH